MSVQTELMREGAQREITAFQKYDGWHGVEFVNHPTPSGCERWLPTYSDKRSFPNRDTAILEFRKILLGSVRR